MKGENILLAVTIKQNEYLTHRFAKPTDIWFHTQEYSRFPSHIKT